MRPTGVECSGLQPLFAVPACRDVLRPSANSEDRARRASPEYSGSELPHSTRFEARQTIAQSRHCAPTGGAGIERAQPKSEAMPAPTPKRLPSPLPELCDARWRTPSSSEGTPIALPSRLVPMP